ncbi:MAG: hypothetical protein ABJF11_03310 [Reichenbachiella sp.]|uniref:hypothetical protein n=1 Tax=Reichenbachiella sp. TaxID=2184521 RepID=UPI0032649863
MRIVRYVLFALVTLVTSNCKNTIDESNNRAISELGIYTYKNENLKIIAYEDKHALKYIMLDSTYNVLLRDNFKISLFHNWGLYLDENKNLWVLSSDIGHSCWIYNDSTNTYTNQVLYGKIDEYSLPKGLLNAFGRLIRIGN